MTYAGLAGCASKQQSALHNHRVLSASWCQQKKCWWIEAVRGIGKLGGQKPLQQAPIVLRGDLHVSTSQAGFEFIAPSLPLLRRCQAGAEPCW
jgi:hypothetical protein